MRRALFFAFATVCSLAVGCSPTLSETPFACSSDASCPEGYACQSSVCVKEGASTPASHVKRATFINSGELTWLARKGGGAELVANDGFSPGARGIFAVAVAPDGTAAAPKPLLPYGGEVAMSSAALELPDGRYGVVTINFPDIDGDDLTLTVRAIERDVPAGAAPSIETLYTDKEPFLGGAEPAYVSALGNGEAIDIAWTRPSKGGNVEVVRIEKQGSLWQATTKISQPLPPEVLPLSGDCLMWRTGPDNVLVRLGYEAFTVAAFDMKAGTVSPDTGFQSFAGDIPIYGWDKELLLLRYGDLNASTSSYGVSYVLWNSGGFKDMAAQGDIEVDGAGALQAFLEPYTAVPRSSGDGVLFGPASSDPSFAVMDILSRSPTSELTKVASVTRISTDRIYSARAFESEGTVYFAWTEFHESLMDLWVAVAKPASGVASAMIRPPSHVGTFMVDPGASRFGRQP